MFEEWRIPPDLATAGAPTADYQKAAGEAGSQAEMLARLVLPEPALKAAADRARALGLEFLSTPFDVRAARYLVDDLGMARIKVGSGELANAPFLLALARMERPLILSTGMATMDEVETALGVVAFGRLAEPGERPSIQAFQAAWAAPEAAPVLAETIVMQCTTQYPAPDIDANLRVMDSYARLGVRPGYSDHTNGIAVALAAAARGAVAIEKHFTTSRDLPGPDQKASLEPGELKALADGLKRISVALGSEGKQPQPSEIGNRVVARRGLVAARPIAAGEPFTEDNLTAKRPGGGLEPIRMWELLGRPSPRAYAADEAIEP